MNETVKFPISIGANRANNFQNLESLRECK